MSQPNTINQNYPNGVPAHLNGVESTHSSRDSSPSSRLYQIPSSQLPPVKPIPTNQLPPSSKTINQLTQNYSNLKIHGTPPTNHSKTGGQFSTSTPDGNREPKFNNTLKNENFNESAALSPISGFTHSATSHFTNDSINKPDAISNNPPQPSQETFRFHSNLNVPLNNTQQRNGSYLPHQSSLPTNPLSEKANLQPSLSQPRLTAYHAPMPTSQINNTTPVASVCTSNSILNHPNQNIQASVSNQRPQPIAPQTQFPPPINQHNAQQQQQQHHQQISFSPQQQQQQQQQQIPFSQPGPFQQQAPEQNVSSASIQPTQFPKIDQTKQMPLNQPVNQFTMPPASSSQNVMPSFNSSPLSSNNHNASNSSSMQSLSSNTAPPPTFNMQNHQSINSYQTIMPPHMNQQSGNFTTPPQQQQQAVRPPLQQGSQFQNINRPPIRPPSAYQTNAVPLVQDSSHLQGAQMPSPQQQPTLQQQLPPPQQQQLKPNLHSNRYPSQMNAAVQPLQPQQPMYSPMQQQQQQQQQQPLQKNMYQQQAYMPKMNQQPAFNQNAYSYQQNVTQSGFNKMWGSDSYDLLQIPNILPPTKVETPRISLGNSLLDEANCHPDIFRCTMTKIPESNSLLQKSRLPLGVLIHPFRDLNHLPVIQCNTIVRCRACRTYINPFVYFVDNKRWKCNLCYRVNELPEEFQYDPVTKTYGDPSRRPEVKTSTIEYIAPAEYMLRPPQPAVYLFLLDISRAAVESGYLHTFCNILLNELSNLPGDARTHIGFIAYDSALHFFSLAEGLSQPHEMTVLDIDDIFLPCPENLLVNLQDRMDLVSDLLTQLPNRYNTSYDTGSALGSALQAAHKMMASTGGRVTVFQASLPMIGPGALTVREDPNSRSASEIPHLNPANDFYKRLALECSGQQIAVDLFLVNSQYVDIATISGISRFSGGCMHHFPLFKASRTLQNESFERSLKRYLTRKIGFEAVMRIRCTRGLSIHTFHGNFFVRSTDLLSLPNINPDAGFGMQVAIEENLSDVQTVCFQAALLYTSSKGERRIRVHTMCLPVASTLTDIINSADQQCIIGLLSKMAVDRSMQSTLADAREAFINVAIDVLSSYKMAQNMGSAANGLLAPKCLRLLPLYISALLKNSAFRTGISTRLDDRVKAMCDMKTRPLPYLIQQIYPDLYPIHNLKEQTTILNEEEEVVHLPPNYQLSARSIDSNGAYLLDMGEHMVIIVCPAVSEEFLTQVIGVTDYNLITDQMYELPILDNEHNQRLHMFINYLNDDKPMIATLQIMRDNSPLRGVFLEKFIEDRIETALSYHEFLQHLKTQVK